MAQYDLTPGTHGNMLRLHEAITPGPRRRDDGLNDAPVITPNSGQPYTPPTPVHPQDDTSRSESPTFATRGGPGAPLAKFINYQSIYEINPISVTECELVYGYATEYRVEVNQSAQALAMLIANRGY